MNGKCEKRVQDVIERFWDFIDQLSINTFGKFLADNIVGSVLVFSLIFWIPFSILVHCVDKKLDKQYESLSLFHPSNVEMLSSMDSASVRIIKPFPAPQTPGRLQPAPVIPSAPAAPKLDHQRMDTIQEDPSTDSHMDEDGFEKDPSQIAAQPPSHLRISRTIRSPEVRRLPPLNCSVRIVLTAKKQSASLVVSSL